MSNNITYYYVVVAYSNALGLSPPSAPISATPQPPHPPMVKALTPVVNTAKETVNPVPAMEKSIIQIPSTPTGLSTMAGNGQVSLNWNSSNGATSYNLQRSTINGGPYTVSKNVTTTSYTDTSVNNGTTYYYVVSALNAAGPSPNSAQSSATPGPPFETITASTGTGGTISPSGNVNVNYGASQTFTVSVSNGYTIGQILVDGQQVTLSNGQYTFSNVTAAHTMHR